MHSLPGMILLYLAIPFLMFLHEIYYTCILSYINIYVLVSNSTNVMVTALNEQIVGQSLMLECVMSTPRGITSRVDVVWRIDGVEVERINDISRNFSSPEVVVYTNTYIIPLLGTYDDDIVYECEVIINSSPILKVTDNVILDVTGKCALIYYIKTIMHFHSSFTNCYDITIWSYHTRSCGR